MLKDFIPSDPAEIEKQVRENAAILERKLEGVSDADLKSFLLKHCPDTVERSKWEHFVRSKLTKNTALFGAGALLWQGNKKYTLNYAGKTTDALANGDLGEVMINGAHTLFFGSFFAEKNADIAVALTDYLETGAKKILPEHMHEGLQDRFKKLRNNYPEVAGMWLMFNQAGSLAAFTLGALSGDVSQMATAVGRAAAFVGATGMQNYKYRGAKKNDVELHATVDRLSAKIDQWGIAKAAQKTGEAFPLIAVGLVTLPHILKYATGAHPHGFDPTDPSVLTGAGYAVFVLYLKIAKLAQQGGKQLNQHTLNALDTLQEDVGKYADSIPGNPFDHKQAGSVIAGAVKNAMQSLRDENIIPKELEADISKLMLKEAQTRFNEQLANRLGDSVMPLNIPLVSADGNHAMPAAGKPSPLLDYYFNAATSLGSIDMEVIRKAGGRDVHPATNEALDIGSKVVLTFPANTTIPKEIASMQPVQWMENAEQSVPEPVMPYTQSMDASGCMVIEMPLPAFSTLLKNQSVAKAKF
jgi:hypothetical protein